MAESHTDHRFYKSNGTLSGDMHRSSPLQKAVTDSSKVRQHFQPPSLPSKAYDAPASLSLIRNARPMSTRAWEQQHAPQTKVISTNQQWASPDHHFRPLLPKSAHFTQTQQHALSLDTSTIQPSPTPGFSSTAAFNESELQGEIYTQNCQNLDTSYSLETLDHWPDITFHPSDHFIPAPSLQQQASHLPPSSRWHQAREYRRKVCEPPYIDPATDDTIAFVEANAEAWVDQLIHAMTNITDVKDPLTSHHRRLFLSDGIDPLLIEACCREIFTALIDRCKNGFRGPAQFNKALKASHQLEPDRTATCGERVQNVVKVLLWNKRACKDVLYEDWKIKLLVNHPLSYDKEKDSQKGSNDQRRRRQLAEREKMEKTQEELKAYREAQGQGREVGQDAGQYGSVSVYETDIASNWLQASEEGRFGGLATILTKRKRG